MPYPVGFGFWPYFCFLESPNYSTPPISPRLIPLNCKSRIYPSSPAQPLSCSSATKLMTI
jgi:hypothetical protein